jgi:uncharacterized protein
MISNTNHERPLIDYPTNWGYKVIGDDIDKLLQAIEEIVKGFKYEITPSNISKGGKYYSLNLTVVVISEEIRDRLFRELDNHPDIKLVI